MSISMRCVEAETLDYLPEDDPEAIRSRLDLQRINRLMVSLGIVDALLSTSLVGKPTHIVELGAGDGSLLLRLARRRAKHWPGLTLTLVDRQNLLSWQTRASFVELGWTVRAVAADVFDWLGRRGHPRYEAIVANLFVHHFDGAALPRLFRAITEVTDCFVACEPRRARFALIASHLVGAIGANAVTRRDAVLSVHAGFRDRELSALWPSDGEWHTSEANAGLFAHTFAAVRRVQT